MPNSIEINSAVAKSILLFMVAITPRIISFLIISGTGFPIFSDNILTEIVSVVITAFSIDGATKVCCCFFGLAIFLELTLSSTSELISSVKRL